MKFFLYDETMMNTKAKITTEKLSAMSDIVSQKAQYITAAGAATPNQITIAAGVLIAVGSSVFKTVLTNLTTANLDTGSGFEMGTDYYIYCCDPTNGSDTVDRDEVFTISKNSTYPSGYTADNSRKIGGFHYGKCRYVNALGNPINSSGAENGSGWQGNVYNGIIPNSVWTARSATILPAWFTLGMDCGAIFTFLLIMEVRACSRSITRTRSPERKA